MARNTFKFNYISLHFSEHQTRHCSGFGVLCRGTANIIKNITKCALVKVNSKPEFTWFEAITIRL